eukprot:INCI8079.1.p2 GENE.INCI8079.1~~INCI8079.1.p2  ORF type:complete len:162 (+),score=26.68 INCI8079.1:278-763(+)
MLGRTVRRVASRHCQNAGRRQRGLAHAAGNAEEEAAKAAALRLRKARGMRKDTPAWNDAAQDAPFLKPRPAGAPREDWELSWYFFMGGSFLLLGLGEIYRSDRGPEAWARDEAEERLRMQAEGEDVERLHNYAPGVKDVTIQYELDLKGAARVVGGDDDDE